MPLQLLARFRPLSPTRYRKCSSAQAPAQRNSVDLLFLLCLFVQVMWAPDFETVCKGKISPGCWLGAAVLFAAAPLVYGAAEPHGAELQLAPGRTLSQQSVPLGYGERM